ncbi:hypothetical protein ACIOJD_32505 [Streptomyces sp. NPDC088116]|uniref:hypothetical protein n=1 Tax=Streptomyces sp. NPDC088116 TaxID=3365825 RepID=UPI00381FE48A
MHELVVGQCTDCAPVPRGLTARVLITSGGSVFHRTESCQGLQDGQRKARRFGRENHPARTVAVSIALETGRGACIICFPGYRPAVEAKACQVRVDGIWVPGILNQWRQEANRRWSGVVTYTLDGDQVTVTKDQAELRPASS